MTLGFLSNVPTFVIYYYVKLHSLFSVTAVVIYSMLLLFLSNCNEFGFVMEMVVIPFPTLNSYAFELFIYTGFVKCLCA